MAYFSNGTAGTVFDAECSECIFGKKPCPIALAQSFYNYDACSHEVAAAILNTLVKQDENFKYIGCQMKPLLDKLKIIDDSDQLEMGFEGGG